MNKLKQIASVLILLLSFIVLLTSCSKEKKVTSIKERLVNQWQINKLQYNGDEIEIADYKKAAVWEFKESGVFTYTYDSIAVSDGDTSYVEGENTFSWKLSDDTDWVLMTNGKTKTTTTLNGQSEVEDAVLGANWNYNMEIIKLEEAEFNAAVEMKDSGDKYTYDFRPL